MVKISKSSSNNSRRHNASKGDSWCRMFLKLFCLTQGLHLVYRIYRYETTNDLPPTPMSDLLNRKATVHRVSRKDYQQQQSPPKNALTSAKYTSKTTSTTDTTLTKHGSGPAKLGYVVDLLQERTAESFRKLPIDIEESFQQSKNCQRLDNTKRRLLTHTKCRDSTTQLTVVNRASFARYLCGNELQPGASMSVPKDCSIETASSVYPPSDLTPIVVVPKNQNNNKDKQTTTLPDCPVSCQFDPSLLPAIDQDAQRMHYLSIDNQWELRLSKQDPYYAAEARRERTDYRRDIYYSTTSALSDIPLSFFDFDRYNVRNTQAIDWKTTGNKATYLQNSDCQAGRRHKWFNAVKAAMEVESFGQCGHTKDLPPETSLSDQHGRQQLMQRNRIVLAFEAGTEKDHITSIVWEALVSGSVPAIVGPQNLEQHLPKNSAIFNSNFNNWDKFAEYVKKVSEDEELWNSYHAWRNDESELAKLETRLAFTKIPPSCRICTWAHAKKYGLGWNHSQQSMMDLQIPRQLCLSNDIVSQPFVEVWNDDFPETSAESCTETAASTTIDGHLTRKVTFHDGVTDMVLSNIQNEAVLTLKFDVHNTEGAYFRDTHTLIAERLKRTAAVSSASVQDDRVKITVLANWETKIYSPAEGQLALTVQADAHPEEIRTIRVIAEDRNELHDKLTEFYPSSFGSLMTHDFVDPLEFYFDA